MPHSPARSVSVHGSAYDGLQPQRVLLCGWRFLVFPVVALLSSFLLLDLTGLDVRVAELWYQAEGNRWALKDNFWASTVLHNGARSVNQLLILCLLLWFIGQKIKARWWVVPDEASRFATRMLGLLLSSVLLSIAVVSLLKRLVPMDCPWDLQLFGGVQPLISLWQHRPAEMPNTQCFPAGHASSGYSWLALYFYFLYTRPWLRKVGMAVGILAGITLGLVQQARGAHFFSHDIVTALICYVIPAFMFARFQFKTAVPAVHDITLATASAAPVVPHKEISHG